MAFRLRSSLRVAVNNGFKRCYGLPARVTGELSWRENHEKEDETSIETLIENPMAKLNICRHARIAELNKVYDVVMTTPDLFKAERLLVAFKHSLCRPRESLPLVLTRACVRVGKPMRALHYARNKKQFGVFPSKKVYNIMMDACLEKGMAKGALSAYELLLVDQLVPDGMTYHLAAKAALQSELDRFAEDTANQSADEPENEPSNQIADENNETQPEPEVTPRMNFVKALEFADLCFQLEPRLGTTTYRVMVTTLINKGYTDDAGEVLKSLEEDEKVPAQTLFNLKLDLLTGRCDFEGAFELLSGNTDLGLPREGIPRLRQAVLQTNDSDLANRLEKICNNTVS